MYIIASLPVLYEILFSTCARNYDSVTDLRFSWIAENSRKTFSIFSCKDLSSFSEHKIVESPAICDKLVTNQIFESFADVCFFVVYCQNVVAGLNIPTQTC